MAVYRVVKDGVEVHRAETEEYEGLEPFGEHAGRPEEGRVELYVDDVLVGVQEPLDSEFEAANLAQQKAEGRA